MAIHSLRYSEPTFRDSELGIIFEKVDDLGAVIETATNISSTTVNGSIDYSYNLTWITDPVFGDLVQVRYDGTGTYRNAAGATLGVQTIPLENCDKIKPPRIEFSNIGPVQGFGSEFIWDGNGMQTVPSGNVTDTSIGDVRTLTIDTVSDNNTSARAFFSLPQASVVEGKTYMMAVTLDEGTTGSTDRPWMQWMGALPTSGERLLQGSIASLGAGTYAIMFTASTTEQNLVRIGFGTNAPTLGVATMIISGFMFAETPNGVPPEMILGGQSAAYDTNNLSIYDSATGKITYVKGPKIANVIGNRNIVAFTGDSFSSPYNTYPSLWALENEGNFAMYLDGGSGRTLTDGAPNVPSLIDGTFQNSTNFVRRAIPDTLPAGILSLQGGVNDMRTSLLAVDVLAVVDAIVSDNELKGVHTILWTVSPFGNDFAWNQARQDEAIIYNDGIRSRSGTNVSVYDLFAEMLEDGTEFDLKAIYDPGDGLHPNDAGNAAIVASITTIINSLQII